ncbi:hypothetical protein Syn7803C54_136 [Synechococcus phage ACG-2014d]|uniref:Gp164 n=1 Tax=Synechococcus phage ACG-2014d TaxID=1493509 RepID=A0A0E3ER20_9CAUD|nr:hypothetical protein Syn7803C54_136 [Synechococcus phage ACG-2014d]
MDIPRIGTSKITVGKLKIPEVGTYPEPVTSRFSSPPVTVNIGLPIVNIPGCVEANSANNENQNLLVDDDPVIYCDAGTPSFNPINYEPNQMVLTGPPQVNPVKPKKETDTEAKATPPPPPAAPSAANIQCPTQEQLDAEPVGFLFDSGRKEVLGYKLVGDQCIREVGDVPIVTQVLNGLPPTGVVITTGGIAVVATTSALLAKPFADILLKVIKPTVKKVLKKVASIRGKKLKVLSVEDRRAEQRDRNQAIAKLRSVKAKTKK